MRKPGPRGMSPEKILSIINVALGKEKADLVLTNAKLVNVYTGEIQPDYCVAVKHDRIAYVGKNASHTIGPDTRVLDIPGKTIIPGFIDAHTHMLAVINPAEYIKAAMLHGTTTIITEIQEITFPLGYRGALFFLNYLKDQPIKVFCTIPPLLTMSRSVEKNFLTLQQFHRLLKRDEVMGLGEPYWLPTIKGDKRVLEFISETSYAGKRMEGHASGARNEKLVAYFSTGITSCHESVSKEETLEKLRLGVSTMVREGGNRTELPAIADIQKEKIDLRLLSLVSDGLSAEILYKKGYMDHIVRQAIRYGFNPVTAIQAATINPATHFALDDILGGIAPGRYADILVVPDIENIDAEYVISKGKVVADKGHLTAEPRKTNWPVFIRRSILMPKLFTPEDFRIKAKIQNGRARVRVIEQIAELVTKELVTDVQVSAGSVQVDTERDIIKVAAISRVEEPGKTALGLIKGFGLKKGAFASSASWDCGSIVAVGVDDGDLALAINRISELHGGCIVCCEGKILAEVDLTVGGSMSTLPLKELHEGLQKIQQVVAGLGNKLNRAHLSLVVLSTGAIPHLRITETGLYNIRENAYVDLFVD